MIRRRLRQGDRLALEYEQVRERAATMRALVRDSGEYPLLSGGRANLYSLFVERAMGLVKPDGFVGLLTPSGIYADKTAARVLQGQSPPAAAFPACLILRIDDSERGYRPSFKMWTRRFKFCALILGGRSGNSTRPSAPFFLHDIKTINDPERCFPLAPDNFARVNPNTGTAPVFRTRRDAQITRRIYGQHPVLVDRSGDKVRRAWPLRYMQGLFNMTSDSHLFRTAEQLELDGLLPGPG